MRVGTSCGMPYNYSLKRDHPHACGDKSAQALQYFNGRGSSPCVWGQVPDYLFLSAWKRIIPMRVGTSIILEKDTRALWDHPHACGDKYNYSLKRYPAIGSSPCVWGQENNTVSDRACVRIIPMRVGTRLKKSRKIAVLQNQPLRFPLTFHRSFV